MAFCGMSSPLLQAYLRSQPSVPRLSGRQDFLEAAGYPRQDAAPPADSDIVALGKDVLRDQAITKGPAVGFAALTGVEKLRRLAQVGTVPGARQALATATASGKSGGKFLSRASTPSASAALELGRGVIKVASPPDLLEEAARGDELMAKPAWYQVGNALVNTSDAMSQYGSVGRRDAKRSFDAEQAPYVAIRDEMNRKALEGQAAEAATRLGINPAAERGPLTAAAVARNRSPLFR